MPCYHPLKAYKDSAGGPITIGQGGRGSLPLSLPCGRCIGCRIKRVQDWTTRIQHEASLYDQNSFITLTYNDQALDQVGPSLIYDHFQKFIRELRRHQPVRFFCAGEYGGETWRPHWHAILFGVGFTDTYPVGKDLVASKRLEKIWPHGNHAIGEVNKSTIAYTASYCVKKITGPKAEDHYTRLNPLTGEIHQLAPEMARMSLKPGIGARWYDKHKHDVHYARDGVIQPGGFRTKPPRYYDQRLEKTDQRQALKITNERIKQAKTRSKDNTEQRLETKEKVAIANQSRKQRMKI